MEMAEPVVVALYGVSVNYFKYQDEEIALQLTSRSDL